MPVATFFSKAESLIYSRTVKMPTTKHHTATKVVKDRGLSTDRKPVIVHTKDQADGADGQEGTNVG